jgi:hypothetical protein
MNTGGRAWSVLTGATRKSGYAAYWVIDVILREATNDELVPICGIRPKVLLGWQRLAHKEPLSSALPCSPHLGLFGDRLEFGVPGSILPFPFRPEKRAVRGPETLDSNSCL